MEEAGKESGKNKQVFKSGKVQSWQIRLIDERSLGRFSNYQYLWPHTVKQAENTSAILGRPGQAYHEVEVSLGNIARSSLKTKLSQKVYILITKILLPKIPTL